MNYPKDTDDWKSELERLAPELSRLEKINPFKVEDEYFEALPTLVMDRIQASSRKKSYFDLRWFSRPIWATMAIACLIFLLAGGFLFLKKTHTSRTMPVSQLQQQQQLNEPVSEEAVIDNVDEGTLIEAIALANSKPDKKIKQANKAQKKALQKYILKDLDQSSIIDDL